MSIFIDLLLNNSFDLIINSSIKYHKNILFFDYCRVNNKYEFLQEFSKNIYPYHLFIIDGIFEEIINSPENIDIIHPPKEIYYIDNTQISSISISLNDIFEENLKSEYILFFKHIEEYKNIIDKNIVNNCIKEAFLYSYIVIKLLNPSIVFIWNQFHPLSQTVKKAADVCGIPVCYAEHGVLPGTYAFDFLGQMGESAIAQYPHEFNKLPITQHDIENAMKALKIYNCSMDAERHNQNKYGLYTNIIKDKSKNLPIIFFAGHNYLCSGVYPYNNISKKYHSPFFSSISECINLLLSICKNNNLFLLYKPHPLCKNDNIKIEDDNFLKIDNINIYECIDISDVTCTILSQVSYLSMIRNKPTVMLGKHLISNKNIVYECNSYDKISEVICNALQYKITTRKEKLWIEHIARLFKYYLYYNYTSEYSILPAQNAESLGKKIKYSILQNDFLDFSYYNKRN